MNNDERTTEMTGEEFREVLALAYTLGQQKMEYYLAFLLRHLPPEEATQELVDVVAELGSLCLDNEQRSDALMHKYGGLIDHLIENADIGPSPVANMPSPEGVN